MTKSIEDHLPPINPPRIGSQTMLKRWLEHSVKRLKLSFSLQDQYYYAFDFCLKHTDKDEKLKKQILSKITNNKKPQSSFTYLYKTGLPAPAPIARKDLKSLKETDYFVADKSDGYRFLLVGDKDTESTYLVDRNFKIGKLKGSVFNNTLYKDGMSIVDGEIIEVFEMIGNKVNESKELSKGLCFNMFDCVSFKGLSVANEPYCSRLSNLNRIIEAYEENKIMNKDSPLLLNNKEIYEGNEIERLCKKMFLNNEQTKYIITFKTDLCYVADGVILTPNALSYTETNGKVLKWKLPKLNTVDLLIDVVGEKVELKAGTNDPKTTSTIGSICKEDVFLCGKFDRDELCDDCKGEENICINNICVICSKKWSLYEQCLLLDGKVCEMFFSKRKGVWELIKERTDKTRPNHFSTVIGTLTTQLEEVRRGEIRDSLTK